MGIPTSPWQHLEVQKPPSTPSDKAEANAGFLRSPLLVDLTVDINNFWVALNFKTSLRGDFCRLNSLLQLVQIVAYSV